MKITETSITRNVRDAIEFVRGSHLVIPNLVVDDAGYFQQLQELPDETVLQGFAQEEYNPRPNMVIVDTAVKLAFALRKSAELAGIFISEGHISNQALHEQQHADAYASVGLRDVLYGVCIDGGADHHIGIQPFCVPRNSDLLTKKIELAAVTAHPISLSAGDIRRLHDMGYNSRLEVGDRIEAHNNRAGTLLPVPLPIGYVNAHLANRDVYDTICDDLV